MANDADKRTFVWLDPGESAEAGEFTGRYPRQAALKAARRLAPAESEAGARSSPERIWLRERGEDVVHAYKGWAWTEPAPDDAPAWLGETVTRANVSKVDVLEQSHWRLVMMNDRELEIAGF